ncbi:MAG TPA: M48 family metallopeptidase [Pyrinomonadaceae bacterium]|jgi:predicted Zn-dependent protease|nr:M48 family metallopeptidase [Pyrinomonadaceae bacterium]
MSSRFSRALTAIALATCVWTSSIAVLAAPQSQDQTRPQQPETKTPPAVKQTSTRPLSTNEDPSKIGKRKINSGLIAKMSPSLQKEVAFGRQIAMEVEKQVKLIDDPEITEYVNRVGQNIVLHSDAKVPFTIKVVDTDEVNAFALPGGFFYVNKGLLLAADNEAELAGVMAHEIAHVAARHEVERQAKLQLLDYGLLAGMILTGGIAGAVIQNTAGLGEALAFLKFTRGAEEEADKLGVQYLYASGYDPNAMATMFEKLSSKNKKKPGFFAKLFATHPQTPDRRAASLALVARFPEREEYIVSTSEFQRVKARLLRLSNARATTAGDISGKDDDGTPGRPTLKRRQPAPDDSSTSPDGSSDSGSDQSSPSQSRPSEPPKLKRRDGSAPSTPPDDNTTP